VKERGLTGELELHTTNVWPACQMGVVDHDDQLALATAVEQRRRPHDQYVAPSAGGASTDASARVA
jgi:hypothetical protein